MKLRQLLALSVPNASLPDHPALEAEVQGLSTNSHACQPGDLFIGMPGSRVDGGEFWPGAIAAGALAAVVSESAAAKTASTQSAQSPACIIACADLNQA